MSDPDLGRILSDALTEHARAVVPDARPVPPMAATPRRAATRRHAWLAPLAAAAAVVVVAGAGLALRADRGRDHTTTPGLPTGATTSQSAAASLSAEPGAKPVAVSFDLPNASVRVDLAVKGLTAGSGLGFAADAAMSFMTGPSDIATVDADKHLLTLTRDGRQIGVYPVSLGGRATPTSRGIKIITTRGASVCLTGPGFHECGIKDAQQLTASGEYLVGAPWNIANIGRINTSSGSTDLLPADAAALFGLLRVGDVVEYPNADGPLLSAADGGYWNVPWTDWQSGGATRTH